MFEQAITWQHALQYNAVARMHGWQPVQLAAAQIANTTLLRFTQTMEVREIRNWIHQLGVDYKLSAIFRIEDHGMKTELELPHLLRFSFHDLETAMLFKLRWI